MGKIVTIHSFRGGTGKTNISANIAGLLAKIGLKVGIVDTDIQSPGIHVLFGLDEGSIDKTLNDFVWGNCKIEDAAHDVTAELGGDAEGKLYLVPSSIKASDVAKILREGYNHAKLGDGLKALDAALGLDVIVVDTHPGCNDVTLLTMALADVLGLILRPDQQDYQGTGVTMRIARSLEVPSVKIIVNKSPALFNPEMVKDKVTQAYDSDVVAVIPHSDQLMALASAGVYAVKYPDDALTTQFKQITKALLQ
jgi:septum site-determining protein MinD